MKQFVIACLFLPLFLCAQKQGNIWYFGIQSGLNFNSGSPVVITGGSTSTDLNFWETQEGTACISDSSGALLFYTSGKTIWNRNHQVMLNGSGINGGFSSTQAALIVPKPGSDSLFYVFTSDEFQSYQAPPLKGYRYSVVNMCLDNGKGAVITNQKNILLSDSSTEKLAACRDAAGTGYWIVGHKMFSNRFMAWHLTSTGITGPVITSLGVVHGMNPYTNTVWGPGPAQGQMKISPNGTKLALGIANIQPAMIDILDFSNATGQVSNLCHMVIDSSAYKTVYGVEFSPDGSKLYTTLAGGMAPNQRLYQFDLTAGGGACGPVKASKTAVFLSNANSLLYGLQLAPDNKIYVTVKTTNTIGRINLPNLVGTACNFDSTAIVNSSIDNYYSLPSFIAGYTYSNTVPSCCNSSINIIASSASLCSGKTVTLTGSGALTYTWNTGSSNSVIAVSPSLTTNYNLTGTTSAGCTYTAAQILSVTPSPTINITGNFQTCWGQTTSLFASGAFTYTWSNGPATSSYVVSPGGLTTYAVVGTSAAGCTNTALQSVTVLPLPNLSVSGNFLPCAGQNSTLTATGAVTYTWTGGPTTNNYVINPTTTSMYTVSGTSAQGCTSATVQVIIPVNEPTVSILGGGGAICLGSSRTLTAIGADIYTWSNSGAGNVIIVSPSQTATYNVIGTNTTTGCSSNNSTAIFVSACTGIENEIAVPSVVKVVCGPEWNNVSIISEAIIEQLEIRDLSGRIIYTGMPAEKKHSFETVKPGVYFIRIYTGGKILDKKILLGEWD